VYTDSRKKRLRQLVKTLNRQRKKQALKIDILCNDFIAAQRNFLCRLRTTIFVAHFYESILPITDMKKLLFTAAELIRKELADINITFFIRNIETFELYLFQGNQTQVLSKKQIEDYFKPELLETICTSNRILSNEEISPSGLCTDSLSLKNLSMAAIPLRTGESSVGCILLYRTGRFTAAELDNIAAVDAGLSKAVLSCQRQFQSSV
jgi:hypothetical protein